MLKIIFLLSLCSLTFADTRPTAQTEIQIQLEGSSKSLAFICECYAIDADQHLFYGSSRRSEQQAMQRAIAYCMSGTQMPGTCEPHSCQCR